MKQFKKLFFILAVLPFSGVGAKNSCSTDCNTNCSTDCDSNCSTSCCNLSDACCKGGQFINKSVYINPVTPWLSGGYLHEYGFRNDVMNRAYENDECSWGGAFQVAVFGGATTSDGRGDLGRRFGLNGRACMRVAEGSDETRIANNAVIDPQHFNLLSANALDEIAGNDFISTICFCPKEEQVGVLLDWKQALCRNDDGLTVWWFEINAPVVHVKHTMGFREIIEQDGGGVAVGTDDLVLLGLNDAPVVGTMEAAFVQPAMRFGRIDRCWHDHTELANLEFKIGYNYLTQGECCRVGSYLGFAAPTTHKRTAQFVFEPVVGQEHWAIMWGTTFDIRMCEWENSCFNAHLALDARWWFQRNERRMFDLIGKPWSRYMEMYINQEQAAAANAASPTDNPNDVRIGTFGANIMARCVEVTPGYQINCNAAFAYQGCRFSAEIGHTFYARQAENICPNWEVGPALKDFDGAGKTDPARTIGRRNELADADLTSFENYEQNLIQVCDIDWNSGAHEAVIANSIYGALGYSLNEWCYPSFIGLGASYDFGTEDQGTSVMRAWNVFGKFVVSF